MAFVEFMKFQPNVAQEVPPPSMNVPVAYASINVPTPSATILKPDPTVSSQHVASSNMFFPQAPTTALLPLMPTVPNTPMPHLPSPVKLKFPLPASNGHFGTRVDANITSLSTPSFATSCPPTPTTLSFASFCTPASTMQVLQASASVSSTALHTKNMQLQFTQGVQQLFSPITPGFVLPTVMDPMQADATMTVAVVHEYETMAPHEQVIERCKIDTLMATRREDVRQLTQAEEADTAEDEYDRRRKRPTPSNRDHVAMDAEIADVAQPFNPVVVDDDLSF